MDLATYVTFVLTAIVLTIGGAAVGLAWRIKRAKRRHAHPAGIPVRHVTDSGRGE